MLWSEGMCSAGEIILRARGYHISHSILMLADLSFMVCSASVLAYARVLVLLQLVHSGKVKVCLVISTRLECVEREFPPFSAVCGVILPATN